MCCRFNREIIHEHENVTYVKITINTVRIVSTTTYWSTPESRAGGGEGVSVDEGERRRH